MTRWRSDTTRAVLSALADQAEQDRRLRVCRVRLTRERFPVYFDDTSSQDRLATHDDLRRLEVAGLLVLGWQKWESGNWLAHVDLTKGSEKALFEALNRRPKAELSADLVAMLANVASEAPWVRSCVDWAAARIADGKKPLPLDWDDLPECGDILRALAAIAGLPEPTLERVLSTRLFADSKRFDAIRAKVVRLLARFWPGAGAVSEDDLFRAIGLDRAPEYVPVAGPIVIDGEFDLTHLPFSVALPAPVLRQAELRHQGASAVVTIENETSFAQWLEIRPPDTIAVLTGGFPSRAVIRLLSELGMPVCHWGDLDAGGLEILAYLRRAVGGVTPLAMGVRELEAFGDACRPLGDGDRRRLERLRDLPELADAGAAIAAMLESGRKLEQEIIPTSQVAGALLDFLTTHRTEAQENCTEAQENCPEAQETARKPM